jgi:hypothetical protein
MQNLKSLSSDRIKPTLESKDEITGAHHFAPWCILTTDNCANQNGCATESSDFR